MPKPLVSQNLNPRCGSIQLTFSLTMRGAHCEIPRKSQHPCYCTMVASVLVLIGIPTRKHGRSQSVPLAE